MDSSGNVYVGDTWTHSIRKITPNRVVTTIAGIGGGGDYDGSGTSAAGNANGAGLTVAEFSSPQDVAVDSSGNVYVGDTWSHSIRKITPGGW